MADVGREPSARAKRLEDRALALAARRHSEKSRKPGQLELVSEPEPEPVSDETDWTQI